jgi:MoxR-like ATPase
MTATTALESNSSVYALDIAATLDKIRAAINTVFLGKADVVDRSLVALLGQGHLLIEDVPGVGKTLLARAIARTLDCKFSRIQFTPDLLPSDILGSSVYNSQTGEFSFKPGPLFANVVLADEINRTSPRTQSALLEAMNSAQVSIDGTTYDLPPPFLVLATQNPFEFEGTYALPESQLDRFMLRVTIGYPPRAAERQLLEDHRTGEPSEQMTSVVSVEEILRLQAAVRDVRVDEGVADYLLDLVHASREHPELEVGVSTRGGLMLYRAAQAVALLRGRDFTVPDDVKEMVVPVLAHRIVGKSFVHGNMLAAATNVLTNIIENTAVPD